MKKISIYGILLDSQSKSFGFKTTERGRSAERICMVFNTLWAAVGTNILKLSKNYAETQKVTTVREW
jgi:hypothetical protein